MLALAIILTLASGQTCAPAKLPRPPTVRISGNSLSLNTCVVGGTAPYTVVANNFAAANNGGWLFKNGAVSGETAAQIRARYTSEEATACNGERCAVLVVEGATNSLRTGVAPAAALADMAWVVDDALSKGYSVLWLDVTDYSGYAGAGTNPKGQTDAYNTAWTAACAARSSNPRLKCLANRATFADPSNPGYLLPAYSCDGVHYTQAGMNLLAARVGSALLALRAVP